MVPVPVPSYTVMYPAPRVPRLCPKLTTALPVFPFWIPGQPLALQSPKQSLRLLVSIIPGTLHSGTLVLSGAVSGFWFLFLQAAPSPGPKEEPSAPHTSQVPLGPVNLVLIDSVAPVLHRNPSAYSKGGWK